MTPPEANKIVTGSFERVFRFSTALRPVASLKFDFIGIIIRVIVDHPRKLTSQTQHCTAVRGLPNFNANRTESSPEAKNAHRSSFKNPKLKINTVLWLVKIAVMTKVIVGTARGHTES